MFVFQGRNRLNAINTELKIAAKGPLYPENCDSTTDDVSKPCGQFVLLLTILFCLQ